MYDNVRIHTVTYTQMLVVMDMESMAGGPVVSKMFISGSDDAL